MLSLISKQTITMDRCEKCLGFIPNNIAKLLIRTDCKKHIPEICVPPKKRWANA